MPCLVNVITNSKTVFLMRLFWKILKNKDFVVENEANRAI